MNVFIVYRDLLDSEQDTANNRVLGNVKLMCVCANKDKAQTRINILRNNAKELNLNINFTMVEIEYVA